MSGWIWLLIAALIAVAARFLPLPLPRRIVVSLLRLAALWSLLAAFTGVASVVGREVPRHIVYLVDQSASIDPDQTAWIARRIASLEALRPGKVSRSVLAFGERTAIAVTDGRKALTDPQRIEAALRQADVGGSATHLESALLAALSTPATDSGAAASDRAGGGEEVPPGGRQAAKQSRVILLSDGRPTQGQIDRVLPHLGRFGLEIYPVAVPATAGAGLTWEHLEVPPVVQRGGSVPAKLVFANDTGRPQTVDIVASLEGVPFVTKRQQLAPGWQVITVPVPTVKTGTMPFDIAVTFPGEQGAQRRRAVVEVEGPPRVLFVLDRPTELPQLAAALKRREMQIGVVRPSELPTEVAPLLDYDAVVLFNVPKSAFTQAQVDALRESVERFGSGLIMAGLGGTLRDELQQEAPLDELLPLRFEPKGVQEAQRRVCMLMLIDRSASMLGPRIAATKRAAVALVKQLQPEDLVGVFAFDTTPYVLAEVQPAGQLAGSTLVDKLARLKATGGTDIYPALKIAQSRLQNSGADVKHVVLLSDGNTPPNTPAYRRLLEDFSEQHISISTIGIGSVLINTDFLEWLALKSGGGYYVLNSLEELPKLVARDVQKALGRLPFSEGAFTPHRTDKAQWFGDISGWPQLKGFLTATAKPGASVELALPQPGSEEPVLAHWSRGTGHVTVFASDADTRWSPDWIRWPQFDVVWAEVIRRTMRARPSEDAFVWIDQPSSGPELVVEGELPEGDVSAELVAQDQVIPLALGQQSPVRWRASLGHVPDGWYQAVIRSKETLISRWIQIGRQAAPGPERRHLPPDELLLGRLAQATHGLMNAPDAAFVPPTQHIERPVSNRSIFLLLAMLLLLIDVALRGRTML